MIAADSRTHTATATVNPQVRLKRLRWRCRRGTRELDELLGGWLDRHGPDAAPAALRAFDALLEQQDPEIQDWLLGRAEPPDEAWRTIVIEIRRHKGLDQ